MPSRPQSSQTITYLEPPQESQVFGPEGDGTRPFEQGIRQLVNADDGRLDILFGQQNMLVLQSRLCSNLTQAGVFVRSGGVDQADSVCEFVTVPCSLDSSSILLLCCLLEYSNALLRSESIQLHVHDWVAVTGRIHGMSSRVNLIGLSTVFSSFLVL